MGDRVADGTRRATQLRTDEAAARVAALQEQISKCAGKANKAERNRLNRELWLLMNPQPVAEVQQAADATVRQNDSVTADQRVAAHWQIIHPSSDPNLLR